MSHPANTKPPLRTSASAIKKLTLPFGWIVKQSSSFPDRIYYFNTNTGVSTWEVPELVKPYLTLQDKQHATRCTGDSWDPCFSPCYESENDGSPFSGGGGSDVDYRVSDPVFSAFQKNIYENMRSQAPADDHGAHYSAQDVDLRKGLMPHFSHSTTTGSVSRDKPNISSPSAEALAKFDKDERREENMPKRALNYEQVYSVSNLLSNLRQQPTDKKYNDSNKTVKQSNPDKNKNNSKRESLDVKTSTSSDVQHSVVVQSNLSSTVFVPFHVKSSNFTKSDAVSKRNSSWSSRNVKEKLSKTISVKSQGSLYVKSRGSHMQEAKEKTLPLDVSLKSKSLSSKSKQPISYEDFCAHDDLPTTFGCNSPKKLKSTKRRQIINSKKVEKVAADPTDLRHKLASRDQRQEMKQDKPNSNTESCKLLDLSHPDGRKPWTQKRKSSEFSEDLESKSFKNSKLTTTVVQSVCESREKVSQSASHKTDAVKKPKSSVSASLKTSEVDKWQPVPVDRNSDKQESRKNKLLDPHQLVVLNKNNSGKTLLQRAIHGKVTKVTKRNNAVSDIRNVIADMGTIKKVISVKPVTQECTSSDHFNRSEIQAAVQSWVDVSSARVNPDTSRTAASCSTTFETEEADRRIVVPSCTVSPFFVNDREYLTGHSCSPMVDASLCVNEDLRDDVCDMEVDEEDPQMIVDKLREFRQELKFHQNEAVGELTQTVSSNSAEVKEESKSSKLVDKTLYIVIDTNILIHDLKFVTELRDTKLKGFGLPYLLIPWVVMQELDCLKDAKPQYMSLRGQRKAQLAVSYLFACFQSRHPRVQGQSSKKASETLESLRIECNDDRVLQAVHQCMKDNPHSCVVLLSGDKNLCNKAIVNGIDVFGRETLLKGLSNLLNNCHKSGLTSLAVKSPGCFAASPSRICDDDLSPISQNISSPSAVPSAHSQMEIVDDVLCSAKVVIRDGFGTVLQTEMEEAFGNMWLQIVYKKPPWSAYDVMMCFQKHWIAVFGLVFNRRLLNSVAEMVTKLSPTEGLQMEGLSELLREALVLLSEFKKKSE
ncbi:transcriptional protein SWT1-like [Gigantopelta aegis]|uniref:transcriptional protein SWT1-like n=1 Tax=Gigantopelta aegis TaxID=1735272 RepID=UPI001B888F85|nr:transcriptional protein SWT1-like [Gigantopelta aegis]